MTGNASTFKRVSPGEPKTTDAGRGEVVLIKVLNNIVKHAYCQHDTGLIEITCPPFDDFLSFEIVDTGLRMPGHFVPDNPFPGQIVTVPCNKAGLVGFNPPIAL